MSIERLKERINSTEFICAAELTKHTLKFHKCSKDGSGKCDAAYSGTSIDYVLGALYRLKRNQLEILDKFEGCGNGYERKTVLVTSGTNVSFEAETYIATKIDNKLRPFDWYKEHVLRGALAINLPPDYIAKINSVQADIDPDDKKRIKELSIYDI
jgi:gamma-glutamylcyclotransferase (GGCT)/AIG2-like uncharacterized protein YtfP